MLDQILENYRKAAETTMQFQQLALRNMTQQWPGMPGMPGMPLMPLVPGMPGFGTNPGAAWLEQARAAQKKWAETVTDMLNKHRETLDTQYRAGIRTIEDAFRVADAKDPEHFRKLTEELWRQSFECLKTMGESQIKDIQTAMQKVFEAASQSASAAKL